MFPRLIRNCIKPNTIRFASLYAIKHNNIQIISSIKFQQKRFVNQEIKSSVKVEHEADGEHYKINRSKPPNTPQSFGKIICNISIVGVGGGGGNAVDMMIESKIQDVDFFVVNTDAQALANTVCNNRIQIGINTTKGLGAGGIAERGKKSAEESIDLITSRLKHSHLVFLICGMGGGTGTGATPIIAQHLRKMGILTVGVVSTPFSFEGKSRQRAAVEGIKELEKHVDTLIVVPNESLFNVAESNTSVDQAFRIANEVLFEAVKGVTDLIKKPGLINLDFADVKTVMKEAGRAFIGSGAAETTEDGESRGKRAVLNALTNPILSVESIKDSTSVLLSISGGHDLRLHDVKDAAEIVKQHVNEETNIILGANVDERLSDKVRVLLVVTGIPKSQQQAIPQVQQQPIKQLPKKSQDKKKKEESILVRLFKNWW